MAKTVVEPILWLLFSAGGMLAALLMPVLLLLFGLAFPLGWLDAPDHEHLLAVLSNPITRLALLGLCVLALFHWAHRFRYTLTTDCSSSVRATSSILSAMASPPPGRSWPATCCCARSSTDPRSDPRGVDRDTVSSPVPPGPGRGRGVA